MWGPTNCIYSDSRVFCKYDQLSQKFPLKLFYVSLITFASWKNLVNSLSFTASCFYGALFSLFLEHREPISSLLTPHHSFISSFTSSRFWIPPALLFSSLNSPTRFSLSFSLFLLCLFHKRLFLYVGLSSIHREDALTAAQEAKGTHRYSSMYLYSLLLAWSNYGTHSSAVTPVMKLQTAAASAKTKLDQQEVSSTVTVVQLQAWRLLGASRFQLQLQPCLFVYFVRKRSSWKNMIL